MKNEHLSKLVPNSIHTPKIIQKEKEKPKIKNNKKNLSKDKILIKTKVDCKNKTMIAFKKDKLNIEIQPGNHKINQKVLPKGLTDASNHKEIDNIKKPIRTLIRHKTIYNVNFTYNIKTPKIIYKTRKCSKIKISKLKIPNDKNYNSHLNNNKHKTEKNKNNIIQEFIKNKIDSFYNLKKKSYDCINKNKRREMIFLINNFSNSSPLLIIKKNNKKHHNTFTKMDKSKKESSGLIEQKNKFLKKKNQKNEKDKNHNKNDKLLNRSFLKKNNSPISKNLKEDKSFKNLKKQNIFYQKKLSFSNINSNQEINSFKTNERIETEPKKENLINLDIIEENEKLNKKGFNFLHNYLKNTVSKKNKIIVKRNNEKISKNNSIKKSKSLIKRKRYSFINRNYEFKFDKLLKAKEYLTNIIKTHENENSIKRDTSSNKRGKSFYIKNLSSASSATNIKIFNGNIDNYLITKELGKGSYATVKLATNKTNKKKYAIKIYSRESLIDPQKRNTIKNEIDILKQLDNINIMKLYEVIDTTQYLYLVVEYINGISLLEIIKRDKNHYFEEKRAIRIFIQIVKGMIYCQSKNICHRDIKLENILLIKNDIVKIIDFGFAVKTNKETYQKLFCGTPSYMAPEIVNKEKYIAQYSDIWSLGILFFTMLYGRFPFKGKNQEDLFKKINEANIIFPEDIEICERIKVLIKKIIITIPTQRLSLNELLIELELLDN